MGASHPAGAASRARPPALPGPFRALGGCVLANQKRAIRPNFIRNHYGFICGGSAPVFSIVWSHKQPQGGQGCHCSPGETRAISILIEEPLPACQKGRAAIWGKNAGFWLLSVRGRAHLQHWVAVTSQIPLCAPLRCPEALLGIRGAAGPHACTRRNCGASLCASGLCSAVPKTSGSR